MKHINNLLFQSEDKFLRAFDSNLCILLLSDLVTGEIIEASQSYFRTLGYRESELIGKKTVDIFHPQFKKKREELSDKLRAEGYIKNEMVIATHKDGSEVFLNFSAETVLYEGRQLLLSTMFDVTELITTREQLRKSEFKFRSLVEGIQDVLYRMTLPDGNYEYVSPSAVNVFGYESELIQENRYFISRIIHPDSRPYLESKLEELLNGKVEPTYEYKIIDPSGKTRWIVQSNYGIYNDLGSLVALEGICRDITAYHKAEVEIRKFKALSDQSYNGILMFDKNFRILYINHYFAEILDYKTHEDSGLPLSLLYTENCYKRLTDLIIKAGETGGFVNKDIWHRKRDGTELPMLVSGNLVNSGPGEEEFMVLFAMDHSEFLESQTSLQNSLKKIEFYQNKLKSLNHQLLTAEDARQTEISSFLHDEIGQLLSIAHMKLSNFRERNHVLKDDRHLLDVQRFLNDAILQCRELTYELNPPLLKEYGLKAAINWKLEKISLQHDIRVGITTADDFMGLGQHMQSLLYRIVSELLHNVIKHARASEITVSIESRSREYAVKVMDNGRGFIYSKKFYSKNSFGLFSIRERLSAINGKLIINSGPGEGTEVIVVVPKQV